jgi:hypothetical protein
MTNNSNKFFTTSQAGRTFILNNGAPFTGTVYFRNTINPNSGCGDGGTTNLTATAEEQDSAEFMAGNCHYDSQPDGEICHYNVVDGFIVFD